MRGRVAGVAAGAHGPRVTKTARAAIVLAVALIPATTAHAADLSPSPRSRGEGPGEESGADPCADAVTSVWKAIVDRGGVVPDIEDDGTQAPPLWWHFPGPRRAAEIFAAEARDAATGLYASVAAGGLESGDVVVRVAGAGACGRMAVLAARVEGHWMFQDAGASDGASRDGSDAFFVDGRTLRPEASAYRIRVKADSSQGHARELARDLTHLERVIAERPLLVPKAGLGVVEERVHSLVDEAWSLKADPAFDLERRELTGRALALAAALGWPGALESAAAVLDDVIVRAPTHAAPAISRASVFLLAGQPGRAVALVEAAASRPDAPVRARYVLGRALLAAGKTADGLVALRRYLAVQPRDARASQLVATAGREPKLGSLPAGVPGLRYEATPEHLGVTSTTYGFHLEWPLPWRVLLAAPRGETGGLLLQFITGRVLDDNADTGRASVTAIVEKAEGPGRAAAALKDIAREVVPVSKTKPLKPLVPGSRHEGYRFTPPDAGPVVGEVTTLAHGDLAYFLSLDAQAHAYAKLKDEYAAFVKSLTFTPAPP